MGAVYKILITGPFNAGKTVFVRAASDMPIVSTDQPITDSLKAVKDETTVALDYGQVRIGDDLFHLYGTPGQPRFDFMVTILAQGIDGAVMVVDSADRKSFSEARRLLRFMRRKSPVPFLVAANKQDERGALSPEETGKSLQLPDGVPVVGCAVQDVGTVHDVLKELRGLLSQSVRRTS